MDARTDSLRHRAAILRALLKVHDDPQLVVRLAAGSESSSDFYAVVMIEFAVGLPEAQAIADMQVRNFFTGTRAYLETELVRVESMLAADSADGS
jgi:hypothetical protein